MTAKFSASADGTKVNIGNAAEDALQIDSTAKTIKALAPYLLKGDIAAQSLSSNGYVKLASGLIIQWGFVTTPAGGAATVTFPIAFSTGVFNVQATVVSDGSGANAGLAFIANIPTSTTASIGTLTSDTGVWTSRTVYWVAIGF